MSKRIYLSPSNQDGNLYAYGSTNEMEQCNRIADAAKTALERCGFTVKKAAKGQKMSTSIAESNALQAKLDAQSYADTKDAAQSQTLIQTIKDQADQDAKAWTSAMNLSIENLVSTYQLNALTEIISARINEAIVNLIQTYNLQKP